MPPPSCTPSSTTAPSPLRRRLTFAALLLPTALLGDLASASTAQSKRVQLTIASDGDLLAFKPDHLTCVTKALVHLTFYHTGKYISQQHNWVLTMPGAADAVAQAAMTADEKNGWRPQSDRRVLAATPPCDKGQHVSVDFIAPAPGDYPFICTTPGHGAVMRGILHVTP